MITMAVMADDDDGDRSWFEDLKLLKVRNHGEEAPRIRAGDPVIVQQPGRRLQFQGMPFSLPIYFITIVGRPEEKRRRILFFSGD